MSDTTDPKSPARSQNSGMPADLPEPAGPTYPVQPRTGGEDDMAAAGKYLLIGVPQFAKDPITGNLMTSYLRLGASSSTWDQDPGGWLAAKIHEHGPPGGHLTPDAEEVLTPAEARDTDHVFIDDDRNRVGGVAHPLSKAQRVEQSRVIHTRGGWRDHSDGNRISTTYGDHIEVVRGNYKKIVLGRQDEATSSAGWDVSGQIIQDFAYMMPGASVRVEESSNYTDADGNNVWHLQNTAENIVQSSNSAGDFFEYKWGKKHWSTTGSESPVDKGPNGYPRQNPHILEKTWAEKIETYTGSLAWPIPLSMEESYLTVSTSVETIATRSSVSTVAADTSVETIGVKIETSKVDSLTSTSTVATSNATNNVGVSSEINIVGATSTVSVIGAESNVTVKGVGLDVSVHGAQLDLTLALLAVEIDIKALHAAIEIAAKLDLFLGAKAEIQLGAFFELKLGVKCEVGLKKTDANAAKETTSGKFSVKSGLITLG